jgi:hypothetical protein
VGEGRDRGEDRVKPVGADVADEERGAGPRGL